MNKTTQLSIKTAITGLALTFAASPTSAGTVDNAMRLFDNKATTLEAGGILSATIQSSTSHSYTDNPRLNHSAWGHAGRWYNFEVDVDTNTGTGIDTTINVTANNKSDLSPAFTVYRTDGQWKGGTATKIETGITGNTPHNFNATGNIGDNGTIWMKQGGSITVYDFLLDKDVTVTNTADSNAIATLAYANSGQEHDTDVTNWGEEIFNGVYTRDGELTYSDGITGNVGMGTAEMTLINLKKGWYTIYVGGADAAKLNSKFSVTVSSVPVPTAVYLFGTGLLGLFSARRKSLTKV